MGQTSAGPGAQGGDLGPDPLRQAIPWDNGCAQKTLKKAGMMLSLCNIKRTCMNAVETAS